MISTMLSNAQIAKHDAIQVQSDALAELLQTHPNAPMAFPGTKLVVTDSLLSSMISAIDRKTIDVSRIAYIVNLLKQDSGRAIIDSFLHDTNA
jgi:hypothetical protein